MKASFLFIFLTISYLSAEEITPYKYTESLPDYEIPQSSKGAVARATSSPIIFYSTFPSLDSYPIAILSGGSSSPEDIHSIIHFHRYFLQEFLDLNVGVITLEQEGVDGNVVNKEEFMEHYTRSNRLRDHQLVVDHLISHPPKGWNGKFIFLGVSEGGPIVSLLSTLYAHQTLATINWSGAGDHSWKEELWLFLQELKVSNPECPHQMKLQRCAHCLKQMNSREEYDALMNDILSHPSSNEYFLGMTYKYHADALLFPLLDYKKIKAPFLVVAGVKDSFIHSSDAFVEKAKNSGAPMTYLRIEDMDHYVRKRPDIIAQSFEWLKKQL